jgi:glyoxylase-like metal-dependent hydrolase (beta-lactamase superfamily II)
MDYRVISIGTLSRHPLWNEGGAVRTPHATTTLIRSGDRTIIVDPALPPQVIGARLFERSGLLPAAVTDVFLTNFRPAHRGGLAAFDAARWWISETERETVGRELLMRFEGESDHQVQSLLKSEIALLKRIQPASDSLAEHVDLFPLPGFTPGTTGLLLPLPTATVLIASDAVPTVEHLERGQVLAGAYDIQQAQESLREAIEIADWIIPGHDNITPNLSRRVF